MSVPEKCDVCGDRHHAHQSHRFARVIPVEVKFPDFASGVIASAEIWIEKSCEVCGTGLDTKRSHARFCSAKCRQVSSRKKRRAKQVG